MEKRQFTDPVLWSNFLFLLNGYFWYLAGYVPAAILVTMTGLASFAYHIFRESWFMTYAIDVCFAHLALVYTVYVAFPYMGTVDFLVLIGVLMLGLAAKKKAHTSGTYDFYHTLWHYFVFVGQAFLAYIASV